MSTIEKLLASMANSQNDVRFSDLLKVCTYYFGTPSIRGSHHVFSVPWEGKPWVNIQATKGNAKPYQVKQVLEAIEKVKGM